MTDEQDRRVGVVLAGGRGRRFEGSEKALATLDGRSLLEHAVAGVARSTDAVVVSCRPDQVATFRRTLAGRHDVALVPDRVPDRGPAAGLADALDAIDARAVAVVACDQPLVDPALLDWLFETLGDRDAAVPRIDGHRQPTLGVYRVGPARRAARAVAAVGGLQTVLDRLDCRVHPEARVLERTDRETFTDVDTRETLAALDGPAIRTG